MLRQWGLSCLAGVIAAAALIWPEGAAAQPLIDLGGEGEGEFTSRLFQIVLLVTVLSLAPAILITTTSFVRIIVVLSLLRSALGLQQTPPNMVMVSLALFLTAFIMSPTLDAAWRDGVSPMISDRITQEQGLERIAAPFKDFMYTHTRPESLELFANIEAQGKLRAGETAEAAEAVGPEAAQGLFAAINQAGGENLPDLRVLMPAFLISELRRAFEIGFLIFMPFLIIDLVVAALLMSMGMMMLPPAIVSLPFKIIFFVLIEGWHLVASNLVLSFASG